MQTTDSTTRAITPISIAALNHINAKFWQKQTELMHRRASEPELCYRALAKMEADTIVGLPFRLIPSFDSYLESAESQLAQRQLPVTRPDNWLARKGGKAPKADALTVEIRKIVFKKPEISEKELLDELEERVGEGVIESIQSETEVLRGDKARITFLTHDGRNKKALVSGLKDRLSRIKAEIKNSR